jgi:septum formation protein
LILASRSPQRQAILRQLGVSFSVVVPDVEELTAGPPEELVLENAFRKASAVSAGVTRQIGRGAGQSTDASPLVLGADTVVALSQRVYGKPADRQEAEATLRALAGRTHRVLSGLCVIDGDEVRTAAAVTEVRFQTISDALLRWYLDTEEWRERAGGYAIQGRGAALVAEIRGDYLNVVGLPVTLLQDLIPNLLGL